MPDELRVGTNYYVQTTDHYCPETRRLFSMLRILPFKAGAFLTQHFNIDGYPKTGNNERAKQRAVEGKLLPEKGELACSLIANGI